MRVTVALATLLTGYAVVGVPASDDSEEVRLSRERSLYPRYVWLGGDESRPADLHTAPDAEQLDRVQRDPALTHYLLYTRANRQTPVSIVMDDVASVRGSPFDPSKQTVIVAHGWLSTSSTEPNPTITNVYLTKEDVNVISVDWSWLALQEYATASGGVPAVGRQVGQLVIWLHETLALRYELVHLVGFSLGAHLVGSAGRETGGKVARVTGLDPAGPLWHFNSERLSPGDGVYVEAIHTDGGYETGGLGIGTPVAQVDFFANGGVVQPGCFDHLCQHVRAFELFASSVTSDHLVGRRCGSSLHVAMNLCLGTRLSMGNDDLKKTGVSGSYRVNTLSIYPY